MDVERELQQKEELLRESLQLLQSLTGGAGPVNHTPSPARDQVYIVRSNPHPSHPLSPSVSCVCATGEGGKCREVRGCVRLHPQ